MEKENVIIFEDSFEDSNVKGVYTNWVRSKEDLQTTYELENYIEVLLNTNEPNDKIKAEISNIQLLLWVYMLGLHREDFYPVNY